MLMEREQGIIRGRRGSAVVALWLQGRHARDLSFWSTWPLGSAMLTFSAASTSALDQLRRRPGEKAQLAGRGEPAPSEHRCLVSGCRACSFCCTAASSVFRLFKLALRVTMPASRSATLRRRLQVSMNPRYLRCTKYLPISTLSCASSSLLCSMIVELERPSVSQPDFRPKNHGKENDD
jgi:hypothetical protein